MIIRSSRMPLAMLCPPSASEPNYHVNDDSTPARLGTAVHEWLSMKIGGGVADIEDDFFDMLRVKYTLPVDEIRMLALRGWHLWMQVKKYFPDPIVERTLSSDRLSPISMTGHADVIHYDKQSETIFVADHKTGWIDADATHQVKSYAFQALEKFPDAERVHTVVLRVRDFETDHETYTSEELDAWGGYVKKRLLDESNDYHAGRHCTYCPHRLHCHAYEDWIHRSIQILLSVGSSQLTPELIGQVYAAKSGLRKLVEEVDGVLKTLADTSHGSLDCGDAYELQMVSENHTEIKYRESRAILHDVMPDDVWNQIFKVRKTELSKLIMQDAANGQKKKAWQDVLDRLEQAQALEEKTMNKLVHRKKSQHQIK